MSKSVERRLAACEAKSIAKVLRVEFLGTLPEEGKAMRIGRDSAIIQIEIPQSEYEKMLPIISMREKVIRFSAEVDL